MLSAYLCGVGITVSQVEIGAKRNEITEIPRLIKMMDLTGCMVTIDAIGTQVKIMDALVEGGADFCLQLKRNHRLAFEVAELYFKDQLARLESGRQHKDRTRTSRWRRGTAG